MNEIFFIKKKKKKKKEFINSARREYANHKTITSLITEYIQFRQNIIKK